jgi:hypothetical protein
LIFELDAEPRSNIGNKARGSIGLSDAEHGRRPAIDLNDALLDAKDRRSATFRPREPRPGRSAKSDRASGRYQELSAIEHRFLQAASLAPTLPQAYALVRPVRSAAA